MRTTSDIVALCAVAVAVLAVGAVHTPVALLVALLSLVAAVLGVRSLRAARAPTVSLIGCVALLAMVLCVVQLLPAPDFAHRLFNPTGHDLWHRGAELAGVDDARWRPLSLDPAATADRAIRYGALAAIALWGACTSSRRRWYRYVYGLAGVGGAALLFGSLLMLGDGNLFGVYEPSVGFRGPSPFVSTNHGASFYGLVALAAAAAAFYTRKNSARTAALLGVASAVFCAAAVGLNSDGVNVALALTGVLALGLQSVRRRGRRTVARDVKIGVAVIAVTALGLLVWLDLHVLLGRALSRVALSGEHGARLHLMTAGLQTSAEYWRFGAGAGAVSSVLPAAVDWSVVLPASIPVIENDPLEVVLSFGWPLALVMFGACVAQVTLATRIAIQQHKPRFAVAAVLAAYLMLVAQLHFPLFALGVSLPALALLEVLWARHNAGRTGHLALSRRAAFAFLGVIAVGLGGAVVGLRYYAPSDDPREALWLQPGSHVAHVKLATAAFAAGDSAQALAHAKFALEREPSPRVRLYDATLRARLDDPGAIEAFKALVRDGYTANRTLDRLAEAFRDPASYVAVLADAPEVWAAAVRRLQVMRDRDFVSSVVVGLVSAAPSEVRGYYVASETYLRMGQPVLARLWAEHAVELEASGDESIGPLLLARALRATGDVEAAKKSLGAAHADLTIEAHREALRLGADDVEALRPHFDKLCVSPIPRADQVLCWTVEARLAEGEGALERAEQILDRVARRHKQSLPLAKFYYDHGQCVELRQLLRRVEGVQHAQITRLLSTCSTLPR